jgi:hypothetical protein
VERLRRWFGGGSERPDEPPPATPAVTEDADDRAYERELLDEEQARLDDLTRRQLRYAEHAWQPPAQGGEQRADDADRSGG